MSSSHKEEENKASLLSRPDRQRFEYFIRALETTPVSERGPWVLGHYPERKT